MTLRDRIRNAISGWDFPCNGYSGPTDNDCDEIIEGIFVGGADSGIAAIQEYLVSTGDISEDENLIIQEINPH